MEISGTIVQVCPIESGESGKGTWKKQVLIVETGDERFPRKVCLNLWGDLVQEGKYKPNASISALVDIESREFNGKWFTDVKAWRINEA